MTARLPAVSVVMPVRDCADYVAGAVDSVLGQEFDDFELVAVEDGSRDDTPAILAGYARDDRRVRVERNSGSGISDALNHGIAVARAPLIARMDGDDRMRPGRLAAQVCYLESNPGIAAVGTQVFFIGGVANRKYSRYPCGPDEVRELMRRSCCVCHPSVTMRRDAVIVAGGYRNLFRYAEDYDLWLRMLEHHDIANLDLVGLDYRLHTSMTSLRNAEFQGYETVVAQRLAERRARGEPEGDIGSLPISRETLVRVGLDERTIAQIVRKWWFDAARSSYRLGNRSQCRLCLEMVGPWRLPDGGAWDRVDYALRWLKTRM